MSLVNEVTIEADLNKFFTSLDDQSGYDFLSNESVNPKYFSELEKQLYKLIVDSDVQLDSIGKLVGVELGGVPYVSQLSIDLNKPSLIVKYKTKGYGTDKLIEGVYEKGTSVIVVMHSITDSSLDHCLSVLEAQGLTCELVVGVLQQISKSYSVDIKSLYQFND